MKDKYEKCLDTISEAMRQPALKDEGLRDGLEDFDLTQATYEVWARGLDKEGNYTGHDYLVRSSKDSEEAEHAAANFYDYPHLFPSTMYKLKEHDENFAVEIAVETVLETEEDYFENVETIYRRRIQIKEN